MKANKVIFCTPGMRTDFLKIWAKDNNATLLDVDGSITSLDFKQAWNKHKGQTGVWLNYLIDSEERVSIFSDFVNSLNESLSPRFYAPRPNNKLVVENVRIVGFSSIQKFDDVPGFFNKVFKKIKNNVIVPSVCENGELPQILQLWRNKWSSWSPTRDRSKYDLIERFDDFFPAPKGIHVVLLNKCNLKCVMCPYHSPVYKEAHTDTYFDDDKLMTFDVFKKIADYASENGIALQFGQIEEPLLHPNLFEFLAYAKSKNVPHIHLTTNGTLLTKSKAEQLAKSGVNSVMFSVDAAEPETYKKIRGASLSKLEQNISEFIKVVKDNQSQISITLSFILQKQALEEKDSFLEKWRKIGVDKICYYVLTEFDHKNGEMIRNSDEFYDKGERYPCASPWTQTVVFPDGEVSLCCKTMTDVGWKGVLSVGNLTNEPFHQIWKGREYNELRNELIENTFKKFNTCTNCEIWSASTSYTEVKENYIRQYNETSETISFSRS